MTDEDAERLEDYIISDDQQQILDQLKDPAPVLIPLPIMVPVEVPDCSDLDDQQQILDQLKDPAPVLIPLPIMVPVEVPYCPDQMSSSASSMMHESLSTPKSAIKKAPSSAVNVTGEMIASATTAEAASTLIGLGATGEKSSVSTRKRKSLHSSSGTLIDDDMCLTQTESSHTHNLRSSPQHNLDFTQVDETLRETIIDNIDDGDNDPSAGYELQLVEEDVEAGVLVGPMDIDVTESQTSQPEMKRKRGRPPTVRKPMLRRSRRIKNAGTVDDRKSKMLLTSSKKLTMNQNHIPQVPMSPMMLRATQSSEEDNAIDSVASVTTCAKQIKIHGGDGIEMEIEITSPQAMAGEKINEEEREGVEKREVDVEKEDVNDSLHWLTQPMTQDMLSGLEESLAFSSPQPETQLPHTQASLNSPVKPVRTSPRPSSKRTPVSASVPKTEEKNTKEEDTVLGRSVPPDTEFDSYYLTKNVKKAFGRFGIFKGTVIHYSG